MSDSCGFCGADDRDHKVMTCINNLREQRDALRVVDDAMVERAVVAYLNIATTFEVSELNDQQRRIVYCGIRDAINAALAVPS